MHIIETIQEFRTLRSTISAPGFVPTMGYLHEGHMSLVRRAKAECGIVVVSIFVNPTQFGAGEDFSRYPRDIARDIELLTAEQTDFVFLPLTSEMYPNGFATNIHINDITTMLEGASRPTHFDGVTTVVCKLFNIVQPMRAYFGQKDAQQTIVLQRMVHDLNIPVDVVVAPTVREPDGLALSSRNSYLSPTERTAAPVLYRALQAAQHHYQASERNATKLRAVMRDVIDTEPLTRIDYVSVADLHTLQEITMVGEAGALVSLAVYIGSTRLIDNVLLTTTPAREAE